MMRSLAVSTIALNEAPRLEDWLASIGPVADQVVLGVDSRTTDETADIAAAHDVQVVPFEWHDSFAEARNAAIDAIRGAAWVLTIDPDERLLPAGVEAIRLALEADVPDLVDGFTPLVEELACDGRVLESEYVSGRLFRATPDLRYVGRVHEEVRYLPDPPRTWFERLPNGPHVQHLGNDPLDRAARGKDVRDRRLLLLRLEENPDDAVAWCYLALMAHAAGHLEDAADYAQHALECGPRTLHPARVAQLNGLRVTLRDEVT